MTNITRDLPRILADHTKWRWGEDGGKRANLIGANLRGADLNDADLHSAHLCGADLSDADLRDVDLSDADLNNANLSNANLRHADLRGADLCNANLSNANLRHADLSNANLSNANLCGANLSNADLCNADLCNANLCNANLRHVDLSNADLSNASLRNADLRGANLRGANLSNADLCNMIGLAPELCTPLLMLLDQPGAIRAYKLVDADGDGPFNGGIKYVVGETVEEPDANTDPTEQCAAGINVATLDWCLKEWRDGYRILIVEFVAADIACIPTTTDGKFRLRRCRVVGEKTIDPVALGLVPETDQPCQ